jgi:hypothetical protein
LYAGNGQLSNTCLPCFYNCTTCSPGFFLVASNGTCVLECPVGSSINILAPNGTSVGTSGDYSVFGLSQYIVNQNLSSSWTSYNFTCVPTSKLSLVQTTNSISTSLGQKVVISDKIDFAAGNFDSFNWTMNSTNSANKVPTYFKSFLPSGQAANGQDLTLRIPEDALTSLNSGTYNFNLQLTKKTGETQNITFPVNIQDAQPITANVAVSPTVGKAFTTNFMVSISPSPTPDNVTYVIYGYPDAGKCAFNSSFNDTNQCGLGTKPDAPNYKPNPDAPVTVFDVLNKFADSSQGFTTAKVLAEGTIAPGSSTTENVILYDPALNGQTNYIIETIVYNPHFPKLFTNSKVTVQITSLTSDESQAAFSNWHTQANPVALSHSANNFANNIKATYGQGLSVGSMNITTSAPIATTAPITGSLTGSTSGSPPPAGTSTNMTSPTGAPSINGTMSGSTDTTAPPPPTNTTLVNSTTTLNTTQPPPSQLTNTTAPTTNTTSPTTNTTSTMPPPPTNTTNSTAPRNTTSPTTISSTGRPTGPSPTNQTAPLNKTNTTAPRPPPTLNYSSKVIGAVLKNDPTIAKTLSLNITCDSTIDCKGRGTCNVRNATKNCTCNPGYQGSACQFTDAAMAQSQNQINKGLTQIGNIASNTQSKTVAQSLTTLTDTTLIDVYTPKMLQNVLNITASLTNVPNRQMTSDYASNILSTVNNVLSIVSGSTTIDSQTKANISLSALQTIQNVTQKASTNILPGSVSSVKTDFVTTTYQVVNTTRPARPNRTNTTNTTNTTKPFNGGRVLQTSTSSSSTSPTSLEALVHVPDAILDLWSSSIIVAFVTSQPSNPYSTYSSSAGILTQTCSVALYDKISNDPVSLPTPPPAPLNIGIPKLISTSYIQFNTNKQVKPFICQYWNSTVSSWMTDGMEYLSQDDYFVYCAAYKTGTFSAKLNTNALYSLLVTPNDTATDAPFTDSALRLEGFFVAFLALIYIYLN